MLTEFKCSDLTLGTPLRPLMSTEFECSVRNFAILFCPLISTKEPCPVRNPSLIYLRWCPSSGYLVVFFILFRHVVLLLQRSSATTLYIFTFTFCMSYQCSSTIPQRAFQPTALFETLQYNDGFLKQVVSICNFKHACTVTFSALLFTNLTLNTEATMDTIEYVSVLRNKSPYRLYFRFGSVYINVVYLLAPCSLAFSFSPTTSSPK